MLCEMCKEHEASVHYKQVVDGEVKELFICPVCAQRDGVCIKTPAGLFDLLLGNSDISGVKGDQPEKRCSVCHMRESDLKQESRMGCTNCYSVFSEFTADMIEAMHSGTTHNGKIPRRYVQRLAQEKLEKELQDSVAGQHFEEAARLRDELAALRAGQHDGDGVMTDDQ